MTGAEMDKMILNYAILNGALELLPQSLASMAIIPLQMKMVYRIGMAHGFELDRGHVKDFLATVGVGLTSQYLEQFGRKLVGGLLGKLAGGLGRALGSAATGAGFSFASTYALGQVAPPLLRGRADAVDRHAAAGLLGHARGGEGPAVALPAADRAARAHARRGRGGPLRSRLIAYSARIERGGSRAGVSSSSSAIGRAGKWKGTGPSGCACRNWRTKGSSEASISCVGPWPTMRPSPIT